MTAARLLLAAAARRLHAVGVASPRVDAELLLAHCLGLDRGSLPLLGDVGPAGEAAFDAALERRAGREPLQHIVGHAPFRHVEVAVGPGVFVPRPETELLVDAVLPTLRATNSPVAVDLCAGSGALALAVANEVPGSRGYAVERSEQALTWLRRNTAGSGVEVVAADVCDPDLLVALRATVDAVLCNPPYVPAAVPVAPEVRADPEEAVFAGADGLALMPAVVERSGELLRSGGIAVIEHDDTHGEALPQLLRVHGGWRDIVAHLDLSGRPRYVTAVRR